MRPIAKSFSYALRGIVFAFRHERNFQIEAGFGAAVFILMFVYPLAPTERALLALTVALVLGLELVNTALERVMDILKPRVHPYARVIKDVMAGAVLVAAALALGVGIFILAPYIF